MRLFNEIFKEKSLVEVNIKERGLYKWQNKLIWIIAILTFISVNWIYYTKGYGRLVGAMEKLGYILDLGLGIGLNVFILWLLFTIGNKIYRKSKKKRDVVLFIIGIVLSIVLVISIALFFVVIFRYLGV